MNFEGSGILRLRSDVDEMTDISTGLLWGQSTSDPIYGTRNTYALAVALSSHSCRRLSVRPNQTFTPPILLQLVQALISEVPPVELSFAGNRCESGLRRLVRRGRLSDLRLVLCSRRTAEPCLMHHDEKISDIDSSVNWLVGLDEYSGLDFG